MKTAAAWLISGLLMVSETGMAQYPVHGELGLYFDPAATATGLTPPFAVPFNAYLIITNPAAEQIVGFEGQLSGIPEIGSGVVAVAYVYPNGGINSPAVTAPEFMVTFLVPLFAQPATVVCTIQMVSFMSGMMEFFIGPITTLSPAFPGCAAYADSSFEMYPLGWPTGGPQNAVARLNGPAPVGARSRTWGGVKALYRRAGLSREGTVLTALRLSRTELKLALTELY